MGDSVTVGDADALVVVDVQNDFCPGGNLAVPNADEIIPLVNRLQRQFCNVVLTQDWHPSGHKSFASVHPGKEPLETVELSYGTQILWPDHCVQGTPGAQFHPDLELDRARMIIRKGMNREVDSYSAFFENDRCTDTGLAGYLKALGVERVYVCGIAAEYCVGYSGLDGLSQGFDVSVVTDATAKFGGDGLDKMYDDLAEAGARQVAAESLIG